MNLKNIFNFMNECDALRSASHINVHKIHVKLTFIWSDLGARCESSSSSISPTHIPRHWPRAQSWVAAILFLPCFTLYYWVASSLYLFLTQIITVPSLHWSFCCENRVRHLAKLKIRRVQGYNVVIVVTLARRSLPDWIRSGENRGNDRQVVVE